MSKRPTSQYDCSEVIPNPDSQNNLNRFFQLNSIKDLEFSFEQLGQAHEPIFWATTNFEECEFSACSRTKKDCEKKIRTYIWQLISEEILVIDQRVKKQTKSESQKSQKEKVFNFHPFSEFKELFNETTDKERPLIIIDVENSGEKALSNPQFKKICTTSNIGIVCVCSRILPENEGDIMVIQRDDLHKESADEGIRRLIYYLIDHLGLGKIGLITNDHFGQIMKDAFGETNQKLHLFRDVNEFNAKYFRLLHWTNHLHLHLHPVNPFNHLIQKPNNEPHREEHKENPPPAYPSSQLEQPEPAKDLKDPNEKYEASSQENEKDSKSKSSIDKNSLNSKEKDQPEADQIQKPNESQEINNKQGASESSNREGNEADKPVEASNQEGKLSSKSKEASSQEESVEAEGKSSKELKP